MLIPALTMLRDQIDRFAPHRSKRSDGWLASAEHTAQNPDSDHEARKYLDGNRYVSAIDVTHDLKGGMDCELLAEDLNHCRDIRIKYAIWDGMIMAGRAGPSPWVWRKYNGANQHRQHLHISVVWEAYSFRPYTWDLRMFEEEVVTPDEVWSHPARDLYHDTTCRTVDLVEVAAETGQSNADRLTLIEKRLDKIAAKLGAE